MGVLGAGNLLNKGRGVDGGGGEEAGGGVFGDMGFSFQIQFLASSAVILRLCTNAWAGGKAGI